MKGMIENNILPMRGTRQSTIFHTKSNQKKNIELVSPPGQKQRPGPSAAAALAASGGNRVSINPDLRAALAGQEPPQRSRVRVQVRVTDP